jgi:molybdate transport system permease protein
VFRATLFLSLALLLAFYLCTFTSPAVFTDPRQLVLALLSDEVKFAILLSIITATCATAISLIIGIPAAYALSRLSFRGKSMIESFLDIPMAVPPVALGVMLLIFFARNPLGLFINEKVIKFVFEVSGIVLAQFAVVSALTIKMLKETFDGISPRYEKIARTLGYTELETFFYITLPTAKRGILGATLLSWSRALGEFGATIMLAGAMRFKTETLPVAIYLSLAVGDLESVATLSIILLLVSCATQMAVRKLLYRGLAL